MTTFWWAVAGTLTVLLALATTAGEWMGLLGIFGGRIYRRCPHCHHLYTTPYDKAEPHDCPHGRMDRAYQWGWRHSHHAST